MLLRLFMLLQKVRVLRMHSSILLKPINCCFLLVTVAVVVSKERELGSLLHSKCLPHQLVAVSWLIVFLRKISFLVDTGWTLVEYYLGGVNFSMMHRRPAKAYSKKKLCFGPSRVSGRARTLL